MTTEPLYLVEENNSAFAIKVEHYHYATKKREEATELYHIEKEAAQGVRVIKELKNPNETHKYSAKACIREINKKLSKDEIVLLYNGQETTFNMYHFNLFTSYPYIDAKSLSSITCCPRIMYTQFLIDSTVRISLVSSIKGIFLFKLFSLEVTNCDFKNFLFKPRYFVVEIIGRKIVGYIY